MTVALSDDCHRRQSSPSSPLMGQGVLLPQAGPPRLIALFRPFNRAASHLPYRLEATWVELDPPVDTCRLDHDAIQQRSEHGPTLIKVELGPAAPQHAALARNLAQGTLAIGAL